MALNKKNTTFATVFVLICAVVLAIFIEKFLTFAGISFFGIAAICIMLLMILSSEEIFNFLEDCLGFHDWLTMALFFLVAIICAALIVAWLFCLIKILWVLFHSPSSFWELIKKDFFK